ncbi:gas vesicle protein GvpO [Nonomuraea sp. NPDC004297]
MPVPARATRTADDSDGRAERSERPRHRPHGLHGLSAAKAGASGLRHIADLTGKPTEGVTFVKPADDGWLVNVEVIEDSRIPSSGDVLSLYEAELDSDGELLSYRRLRRYRRGSGDSNEGSR